MDKFIESLPIIPAFLSLFLNRVVPCAPSSCPTGGYHGISAHFQNDNFKLPHLLSKTIIAYFNPWGVV